MATLRELVRLVHATPGVARAAVVGRDGLVIDAEGFDAGAADHVAALAPGLVASAGMLADAGAAGEVRAVAVEGARGVVFAMPLSGEVTLVAALDPGAGDQAGEALYALRRARGEYARDYAAGLA